MKRTKRLLTFILLVTMILSFSGAALLRSDETKASAAVTEESKNGSGAEYAKNAESKAETASESDKTALEVTDDKQPAANSTSDEHKGNKTDSAGTTLTRTIKASDGFEYKVTASYTSKTGIPSDAVLKVDEVSPDEKAYAKINEKSEKALEQYEKQNEKEDKKDSKSNSADDSGAFSLKAGPDIIFDIKITDDKGNEYQPQNGTTVEVSIIMLPSKEEKKEYDEAYEEYIKAEEKADVKTSDNNEDGITADALAELDDKVVPVIHVKDSGKADTIEGSVEIIDEGVQFTFETGSFSYFVLQPAALSDMDVYTIVCNQAGTDKYAGMRTDIKKTVADDEKYIPSQVANYLLSSSSISNNYEYVRTTYAPNEYRQNSAGDPTSKLVTALNGSFSLPTRSITEFEPPIVGFVTNWRGLLDNTSTSVNLSHSISVWYPDLAVMVFREKLTYLTITNTTAGQITVNVTLDTTQRHRDSRYTQSAFVLDNVVTPDLDGLKGETLDSLSEIAIDANQSVTIVVPTAHGDGYNIKCSGTNLFYQQSTTTYTASGDVNTTAGNFKGYNAASGVSSGTYSLQSPSNANTTAISQNVEFFDGVCKLTDANGGLLYYEDTDDNNKLKPAVFDKLVDSFDATIKYALKENNSGTPYTGTDYGVKMLVDTYLAHITVDNRSYSGNFTLTTASSGDADFPYIGTASRATINRAEDMHSETGSWTNNNVISVQPNYSLTLQSIIMSGNGTIAAQDEGGLLKVRGTLTIMDDTLLTDAKSRGGGAINITEGGVVIMNGGEISDCGMTDKVGGAVYVQNGRFEMNGGTIKNCKASNGGAVYINSGKRMDYKGGTITGNTAGKGPGIFLPQGSKLNISGDPQMSNNESKDIYIAGDTSSFVLAGPITGAKNKSMTIAVYAEQSPLYKQAMQFGTYTGSYTGNQLLDSLKVFYNPRPDNETGKNQAGDHLYGFSDQSKIVRWNGPIDERIVILRKVIKFHEDGDSTDYFRSKTGSAKFDIYRSADFDANGNLISGRSAVHSNLGISGNGLLYIGYIRCDDYLVKETDGSKITWYYLIVNMKGVYTDYTGDFNVSYHGGFTSARGAKDEIPNAYIRIPALRSN